MQDPNEDVVVSTFINSLQHNHLTLSLRQMGPTTYASTVNHVEGYTMAEENQLAHGGELIHGEWPESSQQDKDGNPKNRGKGEQKGDGGKEGKKKS
ncbi:hypothetical protein Ddye_010964 [Dipteronia dyeriana]|uniref:Uncharacterized protein n=1 Tax=Dipteronia dyeriana TaxID=168575 RepID=A0AAE0CNR3_9ROSI|nr:hypothetical protein Ddye_010964 [Dipteronia dyeriana]